MLCEYLCVCMKCVSVCIYSIYVCTCGYTCMYCVCIWVCTCVFMYTCAYMCSFTCYNVVNPLMRPKTGNRGLIPDPDSYSLRTRYPGDSKTDPWMIRRFVPVRAVKTGRRFGSKTASFHVSVYLLVYFLNSSIFILSFHANVYMISALFYSCPTIIIL